MGHIERLLEVAATPEKVFDVLVDLEHLPDWATIVVRTEGAPPRPLGSGDTFRQTIRVAGNELDTNWRVIELARPRHVLYEATGPDESRLRMTQSVVATSVGCRIDLDIDYRLPGGFLAQVMDRILVRRQNEREAERSLQNLKRLVESTVA